MLYYLSTSYFVRHSDSYKYVFFQGCPCRRLDEHYQRIASWDAPFFPPAAYSENAYKLFKTRLHLKYIIVSACMSKESHFSFDNLFEVHPVLGSMLFSLDCPFLHPTLEYPQHSLVAPHFICF